MCESQLWVRPVDRRHSPSPPSTLMVALEQQCKSFPRGSFLCCADIFSSPCGMFVCLKSHISSSSVLSQVLVVLLLFTPPSTPLVTSVRMRNAESCIYSRTIPSSHSWIASLRPASLIGPTRWCISSLALATPEAWACGSELFDGRPDNGSCCFAQAVMDARVTGQSRHTPLNTGFFRQDNQPILMLQ